MSIIKFCFNRQLHHLTQSTSYLAFGYNHANTIINNQQLLQIHHHNHPFSAIYQSDIARRVYEQYRVQGFKYADHGITPKKIAQQIQIHLPKAKDIEWSIDEFGNFIFKPTSTYLNKIHRNLLDKEEYQHTIIQQFLSGSRNIPQQTHYFDYYLSQHPSASQIVKLSCMQSKANAIQLLNHHIVKRTVFVENLLQADKDRLNYLCKILLKENSFSFMDYTQLYSIKRSDDHRKEQPIYEYFGCNPESTIYYSKKLQNHMLQNQFTCNEETKVQIEKESLIRLLHKYYKQKNMRKQNKVMKSMEKKLSIQECILIYGNLIDQYKFQSIKQLFQKMKLWQMSDTKQYDILNDSFNKIIYNSLYI